MQRPFMQAIQRKLWSWQNDWKWTNSRFSVRPKGGKTWIAFARQYRRVVRSSAPSQGVKIWWIYLHVVTRRRAFARGYWPCSMQARLPAPTTSQRTAHSGPVSFFICNGQIRCVVLAAVPKTCSLHDGEGVLHAYLYVGMVGTTRPCWILYRKWSERQLRVEIGRRLFYGRGWRDKWNWNNGIWTL